jgi:hypothetical protein
MTPPAALLDLWFLEPAWLIGIMGVVVTGAAFVVGRWFLPGRNPPSPPPEPAPEDKVFLEGAKLERRSMPRRAGNCVGVLLAAKPPEAPIQGWILNRSTGGLAILLQQPVEEGARLHVRPQTQQGSAPWIPVDVRNCKADAGDWIANCQFVKVPEYSTLLLFG